MSRRIPIWILSFLACALSGAWAQDSTTPPADATTQSGQPQEPVPAYGQDNAQAPLSENPPISGLDMPSLEPHAAPLSYLQPGGTFSEAADTNATTSLGNGQPVISLTHALGSLELRRLWSNYDLALAYVGGFAYYSLQGEGAKMLQQMDLDQKITWKRGQVAVRDSFSYLPEGNFGASYGSLSTLDIGSLANSSFGAFMGGSVLGTFGLVPRISNLSDVDLTENLSPKSAVTATAGYAFTHFYGNDVATGTPFLGVSEVSAQGGYDRILTPRTQIALVYGYQGFNFSISGMAFHAHVIQGMYGHRISGRLDFLAGAGPQFTRINVCPLFIFGTCLGSAAPDTRIGVAGMARLRYRFPKTSVSLSYQRYLTSGSGLFAGAESDVARASAERPLSRVWTGFVDLGYSRNARLQNLPNSQAGLNANFYQYGFVGAGVHRQFGHDFHGFFSYQFNELSFDSSYCGGVPTCTRTGNRSVITLGLDWTPRPIRLD